MPGRLPNRFPRTLAKVLLLRGRPLREFNVQLRPAGRGRYSARVRAREAGFEHRLELRARTDDLLIFEQVYLDGFYNLRLLDRWHEIQLAYAELCRTGRPLILDLGANIGLTSAYFARNWPQAEVIAVEPNATNCERFAVNTRGLENVRLVQGAVASADGVARILNPASPHAAGFRTRPAAAADQDTVPAYSVPTLLRMAAEPEKLRPFIVKIDIEGAEAELFSQNSDWAQQFPILMAEPHDWLIPKALTFRNLLRVLDRLDRDFIIMGESVVSLAHDLTGGAAASRGAGA